MEQERKFATTDDQVRTLYIEGLEPQYRSIAYTRFREGKSLQDVYREISDLRRKAKDRGTIPRTRALNHDEQLFLKSLTPKLRKRAYAALMGGKSFSGVKREIADIQQREQILVFRRKEVEFTLKIIVDMQGKKMPVPFKYYEVAMDFDVLGTPEDMDYELFGKMGLAMCNTYKENGNGLEYQQLRSFMFAKIDEVFDRGFVPHPLMFDFMMKGDWISDKTFMMFHTHVQELTDSGMSAKLLLPLQRMLEKRRKNDNPKRPFTKREEHYFVSLINLFGRPVVEKQGIH